MERVNPGGTIRIAAGIDRVIHITKPLSIIGAGKEHTVLVSKLAEHYLDVRHNENFALKNLTLRSEDRLRGGMLAVNCGEVLVEKNDFIGEYDKEMRLENSENRISRPALLRNICENNEKLGIGFVGSATGTAEGNFCRINESMGIGVGGDASPILLHNTCEGNQVGIGYFGSATGSAKGNFCRGNKACWMSVDGEANPTLIDNQGP